jgi:hypothetical protein
MDVLYIQKYLQQNYGHVLGIFTRNAQPIQIEATADAFVGDGLRLHTPSTKSTPSNPDIVDIVIPASYIGLFAAALDYKALASPLDYTAVPSTGTPTKVQPPTGPAVTVSVSPPNFTIKTPAGLNASMLILFVAPPAAPVAITPSIPATSPYNAALPATLTSGVTYRTVVFVPGSPIAVSGSFIAP